MRLNYRGLVSIGLLLALTGVAYPGDKLAGKPVALLTTQDKTTGEIAGWRSFSEKPGTKTSEVWTLDAAAVLTCRGKPLGYLYTEKDYSDFTLTLQWRWPVGKPGCGGVLIRKTGPDRIWPRCLEAQINHPDVGDFWGLDGYSLSGEARRMKSLQHLKFGKLTNLKKTADFERPAGQWNDYAIEARGGTVTLTVNGKVVNRTSACTVVPGKILLTAEGDEYQFRNLRIAD
jgi:hypothetical protein